MEWKPRETAPTDGTEFLAYDARTGKMDVCKTYVGHRGVEIEACQYDKEYGPMDNEFGCDEADITHWMPLPAPPAA